MVTEDNPKIIYKKSLDRDNIRVSFEPIFINKSLEDGLADLVKSAQNDAQEACWMYVHDESRWYNLASKPLDEIVNGRHQIGIIQNLMPDFEEKRITHYHTHPVILANETEEEALKQLQKSHSEWDIIDLAIANMMVRKGHIIDTIFPSSIDIGAYVRHIEWEKKKNLDFGIVSSEFIAQIEIDPAVVSLETEQKYYEFYERLQSSLINELKHPSWVNASVRYLAEISRRRINSEIPGLRIKIKKHQ